MTYNQIKKLALVKSMSISHTAEPKENSGLKRAVRPLFIAAGILAILLAFIPWYSHHLQIESLSRAEFGEQADALHIAENAVRVNPISIKARFVLAGVQQRLGRHGEARKTLIRATELQPKNYQTWEQLAIYEASYWGEEALAGENFEIAISLNPEDRFLKERYEEFNLSGGS
jgi:tetratricopeptide (TPR) repeat protein